MPNATDDGGGIDLCKSCFGGESKAVHETLILLHPPLPLVDVSIVMERERQQSDSLVNG